MAVQRILVVGAGFAGAVHARVLAEAGWAVDVVDQRPHIAGNCFDHVDGNGMRVHAYGPHLFHTNNARVVDWVSRFGAWVPYEHRVKALVPDGRELPLPVNRDTLAALFGVSLPDEAAMRGFLATQALPCAAPGNAAEHLNSVVGPTITDLFFRPYTRKMWALELEEMHASVVQRLPIRFDTEDRYFPDDRYQLLPRDGYAAIFAAMLDHPGITVSLSTPFRHGMERSYAQVFNSMAIDEFHGCDLGELPYRSIRFHHRASAEWRQGDSPVLNRTDDSPITRETSWHLLPHHLVARGTHCTITAEEPCDWRANNHERYYPVKTADGRHEALYERYRARAERNPRMHFIGRCGTYRYLDMHQVINQSLISAEKWAQAYPRSPVIAVAAE
ncbi:MAG: NAD(P)-binding protein [Alphaproteobacteria bacterium]|nr:NAD(P)-binding protein [Alphaproteobacteria bacterium]